MCIRDSSNFYGRAGYVHLNNGETGSITFIGTVSPAGGNLKDCLLYTSSGAKGARTDKTSGGWVVRLLWKFRKKLFQKKLSKTVGGYDKISYLCIRFRKRWQTGIGVL